MRTVAHLWKQEKQSRSVLEIARQSGLLYDKFVAFVEDLRTIGARLDSARTSYDDAMHKLVNASDQGIRWWESPENQGIRCARNQKFAARHDR